MINVRLRKRIFLGCLILLLSLLVGCVQLDADKVELHDINRIVEDDEWQPIDSEPTVKGSYPGKEDYREELSGWVGDSVRDILSEDTISELIWVGEFEYHLVEYDVYKVTYRDEELLIFFIALNDNPDDPDRLVMTHYDLPPYQLKPKLRIDE